MFLIMSGAYVGQELESEFGRIPPSFLPLGNRRLFQHQVALAPQGLKVYLSLPESYAISEIDSQWLEQHQVTIIATPDGLSLGASLVAALNISGHSLNAPLHILYGDTLFNQLPVGDDIVSVSTAKDSYNWAVLTNDEVDWLQDANTPMNSESQRIIDGYFKFSRPRELVRSITQSEWQFIAGLNRYHKNVGLSAVNSIGWLDFGHVNTYYHSKAEFTTQRAFNELTITAKWIEKSSIKNQKIAAEAYWFDNLPMTMRGFIPQYLGSQNSEGKISYRLEYLDILFADKTTLRLNEFCASRHISLEKKWQFAGQDVSLAQILCDSQKHLPNGEPLLGVLHGDFCFSNILYDFRANKIKTIDPRGMTPDGQKTLYGDIRYDLAKLSHSILGLYDWIIAGYYHVEIGDKAIELKIAEQSQHKETQQGFIELIEQTFGLTAKNLYAMQIQLFLSMLPLHADDRRRQDALFANAFRLHQILLRLDQ
ncbi:capsular biosynthesis protein [Vibrio anguillarum]|uniref:capsular biosynthesis protein n=1 Tax=Vibrio anguillarum TaxID=55601 RepID=UPI0018FE710F|nr:capsular biosynthesis protein [Vibrio anguillarum]MBF4424300.1 capsular biosynthesis protein [Vibrio anguillarum]